MLGKIILIVFLVAALIASGAMLYHNLPGEPEALQSDLSPEDSQPVILPGVTRQFHQNMRFNHNSLTYYIEPACPEQRAEKMKEAFALLQNQTAHLSFSPAPESSADILVGCSEDYIESEENLFIAGEGGPTQIINTSLYNVILQGKIVLYRESQCTYPLIELHELLHVLGFDHSDNEENVMYNFSQCNQRLTQEIIDTLDALYEIEPLPDLYISNISALKKGRYFDFEIEIRNKGLIVSDNASLIVSAEGKDLDIFYLDNLEFGGGKRLQAKNIKLPTRKTDRVTLIIDKENTLQELNENNNQIDLSVK